MRLRKYRKANFSFITKIYFYFKEEDSRSLLGEMTTIRKYTESSKFKGPHDNFSSMVKKNVSIFNLTQTLMSS